jgi:hypothetical protein
VQREKYAERPASPAAPQGGVDERRRVGDRVHAVVRCGAAKFLGLCEVV